MKSKYWAYTYLSIKTLLLNKSILFGFIFNLIIALIGMVYLIIFQPEIPFLNDRVISNNFSNALVILNIIVIVIVLFLFGSVAVMMQSVIDDRDSKVSEIINTSIFEYHYLFGKIITAFAYMVITMLSAAAAIILASMVFAIFNPYDFKIYTDIVKPFLTLMDPGTVTFLLGCLGICMLMLITSIVVSLGISIKANSAVDAFPVSLLVLTPYFFVFGLLIFLPTNSSELWMTIAATGSFVPVVSPVFIFIYVLLNGFSIVAYAAIIISVIYLMILFKGVTNIYSYAFYVSEKLTIKQLLKLSVKSTR